MAFGRYFRGLTSYDLLGNLVPGVILLIVAIGFFPNPPVPTTVGGYGLFLTVAFIIGSVLQAHASIAVGEREHFNKTMDSVEVLPSLQQREDGTQEGRNDAADENEEDDNAVCWDRLAWDWFHPFVGPVVGWKRPPRGNKLDDVILVNRIWQHMVDAYEIPFSTTSYGVLYHVMLSKVDNIDSPSRAIRIQALRNFHRGLWIASWYAFSFITIAGLVDFLFDPRDRIPALGWEYTRPAYFEYWEPIWHLAVLSGFGIMGFWYLSESTEEDYIEYLFADYAVAVGDTENTFVLGTESELSLSGDVGMLREDGAEESDHTEDREQG